MNTEAQILRQRAAQLEEEGYRQALRECPAALYWPNPRGVLLPNWELASEAAKLRAQADRLEKGD